MSLADFPRPQSQTRLTNRSHNIVPKDFYRGLKHFNQVEKSFVQTTDGKVKVQKSKSTERGIRKYKSKTDLIFQAYKKPQLSPEKEYLIDKVVRTRGLQGRYGIDHSEQLAIDQELVNRDKDDYLHKLVYKETREGIQDSSVSKVLLERLNNNPQANIVTTIRDLPEENVYDSSMYKSKGGATSFLQNEEGEFLRAGLTFDEWLKRKEGEKRLKNKLLKEAKLEKKQFYAELAKMEEENKRARVLAMETWLKDKRLEEA